MTAPYADLIERLRNLDFQGPMQHLRDWRALDRLHDEAAKAIEALQAEVERLSAAPPAVGREEIAGVLRDMAFNIRWRIKEFDEAVAGAADAILSALGRTEALTPPEGDGLTLGG